MLKKLILILAVLFFTVTVPTLLLAQAKLPLYSCDMNVAELPALAGVTFGIKIADVKKQFKIVRVLTMPKNKMLDDVKIYTFRPASADPVFKEELVTVEMTNSGKFGITSISLNFRPRTKLTPTELFSKITGEIGLPPAVWAYNDFGGKANYLKWDLLCRDFSGSIIVQTGYMNRLSLWRSPTSDPTKKPIDERNIGG